MLRPSRCGRIARSFHPARKSPVFPRRLRVSVGDWLPSRGRSPMMAITWHGKRDVRVDEVPDPSIEKPTDMIVRLTTTNICGSDLHLYEVLTPFMNAGDI